MNHLKLSPLMAFSKDRALAPAFVWVFAFGRQIYGVMHLKSLIRQEVLPKALSELRQSLFLDM